MCWHDEMAVQFRTGSARTRSARAAAPSSFLQLGLASRATSSAMDISEKVVQMQTVAPKRSSSPVLSAATLKLEVAVDHFVKSHSLTKVLIARLKGRCKEGGIAEVVLGE